MSPPVIAVDLGGTNTRVALFDGEQTTPIQSKKFPTQAQDGPDAVIERILAAIEALAPEDRAGLRVGVGAPGPLDPRSGVVFEAPNLLGWIDIPLRDRLQNPLGCPVAIGNDANLAGLGEWRHGAGRGARDLVYLTISTGVGGGVICNGELLVGTRGIAAELGHVLVAPDGPRCGCGQRGHLEAVASGPAIARRAQAIVDEGVETVLAQHDGQLTAGVVGRAAQAGDAVAREVFDQAAEYLGIGLAVFAHMLNPEIFILGGGVSQVGPLLFDPARDSLERHVLSDSYLENLRIVPASLGDDAGLIGAMTLAADL
jgi:glucokinase